MDDSLFTLDLDPNGRSVAGSSRSDSFLLTTYIGDAPARLVRVAIAQLGSARASSSPLLLYGPKGVGKSLLARIVAQRLQALGDPRDVLVYSGAALSKACGLAAETNALTQFGNRLQNAAALIIDDLHELAGKQLVEEQLRTAIDQLERRERWVVATTTTLPSQISGMSAGLRSRLLSGLVVPLAAPGPQARHEIIRRLAMRHGIELTDDAHNYLASLEGPSLNGESTAGSGEPPITVARLDRMLERLTELAEGEVVDAAFAQRVVGSIWNAHQPELRSISAAVARYFDQKQDELRGPARRKELVQARGIAMYLARQLTDKSLWQVGKHFGNRDHSTVLHACRRTRKLMQQDAMVRKAIEDLASQFTCS